MNHQFEALGRTERGGHTESWHFGAVAVVTPDGRLVAAIGNPELRAFSRSASKPFQVLPLLQAGGCEHFGLEMADVALMCASHAGAPFHTERVLRLLGKGGFGVDNLLCGPHEPLGEEYGAALRSAGEYPTPLHNNCSGKHAGLLLACRALDFDPDTYTAAEHPLQQQIREVVAKLTSIETGGVEFAVDGCGLPTFRVPLSAVALAYARLASPQTSGFDPGLADLLVQVVEAMTTEPSMVSGPGRFTTRLMEVTRGRVLGKEGAAGFYAAAVRGPVALGVALKVASGEDGPREAIVLDLLRQLGSLSAEEVKELESCCSLPVRNHSGDDVGSVKTDLELTEIDPSREIVRSREP